MKNISVQKTIYLLATTLSLSLAFITTLCSAMPSNDPLVIEDQFGSAYYTITIYDIRSYVMRQCTKQSDYQQNNLFLIKNFPDNKYEARGSFTRPWVELNALLEKYKDGQTIAQAYTQRVLNGMDKIKNKNYANRQTDLFTLGGDFYDANQEAIIERDAYNVPAIINDYTGEMVHDRANLFDMFSLELDEHLLDYGIGEIVDHRNFNDKKSQHTQITLFGSLSVVLSDNQTISYLGFFQYTFNRDKKCYHRAFKPWTNYHLKRISNAPTQIILKLALSAFFCDHINDALENSTQRLLTNFFEQRDEEARVKNGTHLNNIKAQLDQALL